MACCFLLRLDRYFALGEATRNSMSLPPSLSGNEPYIVKLYIRRSAG